MGSTIKWSRQFQQDVGPADDDGNPEWDYRYFSYWFELGDGRYINGVQYRDSPERCSFVRYYDSQGRSEGQIKADDFLTAPDLGSVARFLSDSYDVGSIEVLTSDYLQPYKPIPLADVIAKANVAEFIELEEEALTQDFSAKL